MSKESDLPDVGITTEADKPPRGRIVAAEEGIGATMRDSIF